MQYVQNLQVYNYYVLAWKPGAAQVTHSYYRHLPALGRNYIFAIKVNPIDLKLCNQAKNIPMGLPSSPIKMLGKSVQGFRNYDRTYKQADDK